MRNELALYERRHDKDLRDLASKDLAEAMLQFEVELRMAIIFAEAKYSDARYDPNTADHEVEALRGRLETLNTMLGRGLFLGIFEYTK